MRPISMPPTRQVSNTSADARREVRFRHFGLGNDACMETLLTACVCCSRTALCAVCFARLVVSSQAWCVCRSPIGTCCSGMKRTVSEEQYLQVAGRCAVEGVQTPRQPQHLPAALRPMAAALQANEVRSLSSPTLLLWQHAVSRLVERGARCPLRRICAQAAML